jgi:hypothetical protein
MKINYILLAFSVAISALLSYGFLLLPNFFTTSSNLKITIGLNMFLIFSLCLSLGLAISTQSQKATLLIKTAGFSAFLLSILLFFILKLLVVSPGIIIVFSGLFFLFTLLITYALQKSKV